MQDTKLIPLPIPTGGVHRELSRVDLDTSYLHDSENWLYRDGRFRVRDGLTVLGDHAGQSGRPVGFVGWFDGLDPVLVMATTAKYYEWDQPTAAWIDRGGSLTGDETTHNIMRVYQKASGAGAVTTMYGCNGKDTNKKFVLGDAAVSSMGAGVPISKAMMVLADRMLLGNIVGAGGGTYAGAVGPQVVSVSNSQDPTTGYGTVLEDQLADTPGDIVCMMEMGNLQGAIYKTDAIYLATAASDIVPYTFSLKAVVPGPVSARAVVRINDSLHIYLATNGDIMKFDGVSAVPLGRHLQRYVLDHWNYLVSNRSHGWYDHENNEVVICFPDLIEGDCSRALNIRLTDDPPTLWPYRFDTLKITAGIRAILPGGVRYVDLDGVPSGETLADLTLPLSDYDALGTALVVGDITGDTYTNTGTTDNGSPIPTFCEGGLVNWGVPNKWKSIKFMDLIFADPGASQTFTVKIAGMDYGGDSSTLSTDSIDINSTGFHRTYHRCSGRHLGFRFECNASYTVEINAGHLAYVEQGQR